MAILILEAVKCCTVLPKSHWPILSGTARCSQCHSLPARFESLLLSNCACKVRLKEGRVGVLPLCWPLRVPPTTTTLRDASRPGNLPLLQRLHSEVPHRREILMSTQSRVQSRDFNWAFCWEGSPLRLLEKGCILADQYSAACEAYCEYYCCAVGSSGATPYILRSLR